MFWSGFSGCLRSAQSVQQSLGDNRWSTPALLIPTLIEKAKQRLGYVPVSDFHEGIRKAVAWSLNEDGWSQRLKKIN